MLGSTNQCTLSQHSLNALSVLLLFIVEFFNFALADTLTVGIFPRRDAAVTAKLFRPFSEYLEKRLEIPVRLEMSPNFDVFLKRLQQRRYDLVHLNQYEYVNAHKNLGYDVIAQNEEFGEKTIRGAIYVRRDANINHIDQLRGKIILFGGGPRAMMSYIVPTYLLRQAGLQAGEYEERYASNPPNAVLATFQKQVDAGGAGEVVRRLPLVTGKIKVDELKLVAVSEPLPHLPWAVKQEMDETLKSRLAKLLFEMKRSLAGRSALNQARLTAINPAQDEDYNSHRKIIDAVYAN
jgi:phosphonate transport system substrate-binding protein